MIPASKKQIATIPNKSQESRRRGPVKGATYVPQPEQEAIKRMYINSNRINEISKEIHRDWSTV
jgi:hypothetical protein